MVTIAINEEEFYIKLLGMVRGTKEDLLPKFYM